MRRAFLGQFEQMVLLAILRLREKAEGLAVLRELEAETGASVSRGALYTTLDRLHSKGHVTWSVGESTPERGGLPKRRYQVTPSGVEALRASRAALVSLWRGLEEVLDT